MFSTGNPVITGTTISSSWANNTLNDIANNGLTNCVLKDGSQTITANIPMSSFKFTGLAAGSASGDSVRFEQLLGLGSIGTKGQYPAVNTAASSLTFVSGIQVLARSGAAVSGAADTAENTLATITIPANALGSNGVIRIITGWTFTNGADDKIIRIRFSGASGTQFCNVTNTTVADLTMETIIINSNATNAQYGYSVGRDYTGPAGVQTTPTTAAVDTTAQTTIVITGQKETGANTLTLNMYVVEIMPG